jgi:hypothetical protein
MNQAGIGGDDAGADDLSFETGRHGQIAAEKDGETAHGRAIACALTDRKRLGQREPACNISATALFLLSL